MMRSWSRLIVDSEVKNALMVSQGGSDSGGVIVGESIADMRGQRMEDSRRPLSTRKRYKELGRKPSFSVALPILLEARTEVKEYYKNKERLKGGDKRWYSRCLAVLSCLEECCRNDSAVFQHRYGTNIGISKFQCSCITLDV